MVAGPAVQQLGLREGLGFGLTIAFRAPWLYMLCQYCYKWMLMYLSLMAFSNNNTHAEHAIVPVALITDPNGAEQNKTCGRVRDNMQSVN